MSCIYYYVSDYGFGHATRSVAVIRGILSEFSDAAVHVKAGFAAEFLRQTFRNEGRVTVHETGNDMGVSYRKGTVKPDRKGTLEGLERWSRGLGGYRKREARFIERTGRGIIISDVPPQPFEIARDLGMESLLLSNFTWYFVFSKLIGSTPVVEWMRKSYSLATRALVLPFSEDIDYVGRREEIGLVARGITRTRDTVRKSIGVGKDEKLVFIGIGRSLDKSFMRHFKAAEGVRILTSSHVGVPSEDAVRIPAGETEAQDYIAACDMAVTKSGYGTVSECIRGRVPIMLLKRGGFPEDRLIEKGVVGNGIGKSIGAREFLSGGWVKEMDDIDKYKTGFQEMQGRLRNDGLQRIIDVLKGMEWN